MFGKKEKSYYVEAHDSTCGLGVYLYEVLIVYNHIWCVYYGGQHMATYGHVT